MALGRKTVQVENSVWRSHFRWKLPKEALWWVAITLMGIAVVLTVVTGADYVRKTITARREQLS